MELERAFVLESLSHSTICEPCGVLFQVDGQSADGSCRVAPTPKLVHKGYGVVRESAVASTRIE